VHTTRRKLLVDVMLTKRENAIWEGLT